MRTEITIKNYRRFEDGHPLRITLDNGLTAFVGLNNSGKSSILRVFYEFRNVWGSLSSPSSDCLEAIKGKGRALNLLGVQEPTEPFSNLNDRDISFEFEFKPDPSDNHTTLEPTRCEVIAGRNSNIFIVRLQTRRGKVEGAQRWEGTKLLTNEGRQVADLHLFFDFFSTLRDALYIGPFRNALNIGSTSYFDINVGTAFIQTWHDWLTGPIKKHNNAIKSVVRNIQRIFEYDELEIIAALQLNTLQVFANGKPYKLPELGGGITQFIVVLGNAAIRTPSFILIDEPELNLHPALQLDFLTSLASYSTRGLLFATHSIGLARSGADRVYSVHMIEEASDVTPYEETPRLAEFLGEMSFAGFRELGFEKVLLVEGSSDIKTVQQFLRLLRKDHKVVPLSLGGSSMINSEREEELAEVLRISPHVSALIDSEREEVGAPLDQSRQDFVETCQRLEINVHVLERHAIENYLTDTAVQAQMGEKYHALGPYESLSQSVLPWGKHENWRIARRMGLDAIAETDLGRFLKDL